MKPDMHPTYHTNVKVTCACGNTFVTGSTVEEINIEICANCHPFFTGKSKLVDTAGRVDKFKARVEAAKQYKAKSTPKTSEPAASTQVTAEVAEPVAPDAEEAELATVANEEATDFKAPVTDAGEQTT